MARTDGSGRLLAAGAGVVGKLEDGTPYFAPVGEVEADGDLVRCHLCGSWRRSVTAHLRAHGWTKDAYCAAFGLERGQSLEGEATRKLRAASFSARLVFDVAVRDGSARGRARARSGELAKDAAVVARGRPVPEQRRRKAREVMAGRRHPASVKASQEHAQRHLLRVAALAAAQHGYADIGALVRARTDAGASLAAISREAGLHKDWLSRHLATLDPETAAAVKARPVAVAADARWIAVIGPLGFADVPSYLRDRHLSRHQTVNQIAGEVGLSYHAVESALRRHGLARIAHAGKRYAAGARADEVADKLGFASVADYVTRRRADGWTWSALAAESGQPQSWLRRHS
jgi:lambda repressor-like predicted transcriptional regulator